MKRANLQLKTTTSVLLQLLQFIVLLLITTVGSAQLRADFTATPVTGCPPMVVSFTDKSTGSPVSWKWDLGNGTTSFLQNPIATYFTPGSYNIKLTVSNASGKDSIVKSQYVVVNALPVAYFSASDTTGCFPLKVQFKDSSIAGSGSVAKWQWDFGDGALSSDQNPSHTYTSPGTFNVILRVFNTTGCSAVLTKKAYITTSTGVKAGFSFLTVPGCQNPAPVKFVNESSGTGTLNYKWDFGDGNTSTATNPTNNYKGGIYTVKLIAANSIGCSDTIVKNSAVAVGLIKAQFSSADTVCDGQNIKFTNTSTPSNYTSSKWDFGDGSTSTLTNPDKVYASPGSYKVKLVVVLDACKDSVTKTVTVLSKPVAAFTASNVSGCTVPLNVSFSNQSSNGNLYKWSFGDGDTSIQKNPVHGYTSGGTYSVSLTVSNHGCSATISKDNLVNLTPLKIESIKNLGVKGCVPLTASPVAVMKDNLPVASYQWDFGDGSKSSDATPSHTYTTSGVYDVKLIVATTSGCTDTFTFKEAVRVGIKPATKITADANEVCADLAVNFTGTVTNGTVDQWKWFFGDGGTASEQNPKYTYKDTGYFDVTLISENFGCEDTLIMKKFLYVRPPIARFDTSYLCNDPLKKSFIDRSVGANSWNWNFGDGSTSTSQNPSHTYSNTGNYPVVLIIANGACHDTASTYVRVINEHGKLSVSDSVSCINAPTVFGIKEINKSNISNYSWYVNGMPGNAINTNYDTIVFRYNSPGTYSPVVIITDLLNCYDTISSTVSIKSYGPKVAFGSAAPSTCLGNTITFFDSSKTDGIHPITQYVWSYGEGGSQTYTAGPFFHNYSAIGTFDVKMVVKDSYGCVDSSTKVGFVSITKPVAKFSVSDTSQCPSAPITFKNASSGVALTYQWNFGDGTTSDQNSPVHSFNGVGTYKVLLIATDKNGCTASDSAIIHVAAIKANFSMSDTFSTCPPLVVNITNQSSNYSSLNWDFGDGGNSQLTNPSHTYTYPGKYTVKLTVKSGDVCIDELTKYVVIEGPSGKFDYSPKEACKPGKVDYTISSKNSIKYVWDFNDGTTIFSVNPTVSHTYENAGFYVPKIILEDSFGCKLAVPGLDTVKIYSVNTNIVSNTRIACDSDFVLFHDSTSTNDVVKNVLWNFGDGTTSTLRNPTHSYTDAGFYSVQLITTTNFGCSDTSYSKNYIKAVSKPLVKILGDTSACETGKLQFEAGFVRQDTSAIRWSWDFGNGNSSDKQKPDSQIYSKSSSYNVALSATNSDGCVNTVTRTAVIHPIPAIDAGLNTVICRFDTYALTATGANSYSWSSNPFLSCTNCATQQIKPDSTSTYYVTGKTAFGCTNIDSVKISVQQPFKIAVSKPDTICKGETVLLQASGADSYQWLPSLWLDKPTIASPRAKPDTTITYQVVGSDINGCFKDSQNVSIRVNPVPSIDITNGQNITVPIGGSVQLTTKSSPDVTDWKWLPAQWLSCTSCAEPVTAPKDHITYNVIATNEWNCSATDKVTIDLICNNTNVYIPNTFSPNADGVNDIFYLRSSGTLNIVSFKVFNKWGNLVFLKNGGSANNPLDGWDGNFNGQPLQSDVYVYFIEVSCSNNTVLPLKGNISLIR